MKTKILHVNKAYTPDIGGVESVCKQCASLTRSFFDEVSVITLSNEYGFGWYTEVINGVTVTRHKCNFKLFGHGCSITFLVSLFRKLFSNVYVHSHDPFPLATLAFSIKKPRFHILTYHADITKQWQIKFLVDWLRLQVIKRANLVITSSNSLAKYSDVLSKHPMPKKIKIVPLYLEDTSVYRHKIYPSPLTDRAKKLLPTKDKYFLMIGRLNHYKGLDFLNEALSWAKKNKYNIDGKIVIAGKVVDGGAKKSLERLRDFDSVVDLTGETLTEQQKIYLLQNCFACLFPSDKTSEAFGIIQLEALASGKTIINVNLRTGVPWIGKNKYTGLTVNEGDVTSLAAILCNSNGEHEELLSLRQNCRKHLDKNFAKETSEAKLQEIYQNALSDY